MTTESTMSGPVRPGRILLTFGAVIGATCLVAAAVCLVLGLRPLVFQSGSMSPAIPTGSLALAENVSAADLAVGDVVSVVGADGQRVTHRIVNLEVTPDGRASLTMRGDANATPDAEPYVVATADRVVVDVPWLGYPVAWLSTPAGLLGLGVMAGGLLVYAFRPTSAEGRRRRTTALLVVPTATVAVVAGTTHTGAWFTDTGTVTSGAFATHSVAAATDVTCESGLLRPLSIDWTHPSSSSVDEYRVVLTRQDDGSVVHTYAWRPATTERMSQTVDGYRDRLPIATDYWAAVQSRDQTGWVGMSERVGVRRLTLMHCL